jgi:cytidylate kinase
MNIITISREFGSGGRELGKRLADILGYDYYDREIITTIAKENNLDSDYVEFVLENNTWQTVPLTFRQSFTSQAVLNNPATEVLLAQKKLLDSIAKSGKSCVIVGRNADILLKDHHPLNIFVCADIASKINRCRNYSSSDEQLSEKAMRKKIKKIDKNRALTREMLSGGKWGERTQYHLTVNTTGWTIKELAPCIAQYAIAWFNREKC